MAEGRISEVLKVEDHTRKLASLGHSRFRESAAGKAAGTNPEGKRKRARAGPKERLDPQENLQQEPDLNLREY